MNLLTKSLCHAALFAALGAGFAPARAQEDGLMAMAARPGQTVIARAWHGRTPRAKADEYERYLTAALVKFPTIKGNLGYQMMRLDGGPDGDDLVEFQVVSYWESLDSIKAYAGEDIRRTHDLPRDKEYLVNMEPLVRNYELKVNALKP
jgi:heme-degrading monooxygenase HmoA